jgi:hypothetical protein
MAIDIPPYWRPWIQQLFPELIEGTSFEFTSEVDFNYNCLSWALSINHSLLDDVHGGFWPWPEIYPETVDGGVEVCKIHGFTLNDNLDTSFVPGYEKIAIFEGDDESPHACRQDRYGMWKSKLGANGPDIDHTGLEGLVFAYGNVVRVLQKHRPDW